MKRAKEIFDKYFVAILCTVTISLGGFVWDYANRFFSLPSRVEKMEIKQKQDSAFYRTELSKKDSVINMLQQNIKNLEGFADEDYKSIQQIKTYLNIE